MNRISLVCYGKLKSRPFQEVIEDFNSRIRKLCPFELFILKAEKIESKDSNQKETLRSREAVSFFDLLDSKAFKQFAGNSFTIWVLDETGISYSTEEWAENFRKLANQGQGSLVIVIGGSLGLSDEMKQKAHKLISFGRQTMNHELTRVVTVEQIYRTLSVLNGHPYHND